MGIRRCRRRFSLGAKLAQVFPVQGAIEDVPAAREGEAEVSEEPKRESSMTRSSVQDIAEGERHLGVICDGCYFVSEHLL